MQSSLWCETLFKLNPITSTRTAHQYVLHPLGGLIGYPKGNNGPISQLFIKKSIEAQLATTLKSEFEKVLSRQSSCNMDNYFNGNENAS